MISGYHQQVADHYEKFPYPRYPFFAQGRWNDLNSVDLKTWNLDRAPDNLWIAGAGTISSFMFARRNPHTRIVASDLSEACLKISKRRLQLFGYHNVELKKEDVLEVNYPETFDAIDCYGVLHHTFSPVLCLKRLAGSLKRGGVLRLMVYSEMARAEIEALRAELVQQGIFKIEGIQKYLEKLDWPKTGDFRSVEGIADALLNPIVHVYSQESFNELLDGVPELQLIHLEEQGNFVAKLKKVDAVPYPKKVEYYPMHSPVPREQ